MDGNDVQGTRSFARLVGGRPWGFTIKEMYNDRSLPGVFLVISKVDSSGKSAELLHVGDLLVEIDGSPCSTVAGAKTLMQRADHENHLTLTVWRQRENCSVISSDISVVACEFTAVPVHADDQQQQHSEASRDCNYENADVYADHHLAGNLTAAFAAAADNQVELIIKESSAEHECVATAETEPIMDIIPEMHYSDSDPSIGQRGSISALHSNNFYALRHDNATTNAVSKPHGSRFSRQSLDASYPLCGLPSGTLYRKATGAPSSADKRASTFSDLPGHSNSLPRVSHSLLALPLTQENMSRYGNLHRNSVSGQEYQIVGSRYSFTPSSRSGSSHGKSRPLSTVNGDSYLAGGGGRAQNMNNLLHHHKSGSLFHAMPTASRESSWSEGSSARLHQNSSPYHRPAEEVTRLSGAMRGLPVVGAASQSYASEKISSRSGSNFETNSDGVIDRRHHHGAPGSVVLLPRVTPLDFGGPSASSIGKESVDRGKCDKRVITASSSSPAEGSAFSVHTREPDRDGRAVTTNMPAVRPHSFLPAVSDDLNNNNKNNLTTVKEVRTYHIRPKFTSVSDPTSAYHHGGSPSGVRSASSTAAIPDECRHLREASLDSSVSWHSNSTTSSGYSSVALSSSTPTFDMHTSEETLVPMAEYLDFPDRSNMEIPRGDPVMRSTSKTSVYSGQSDFEPPIRSLSVSELVKTFADTKSAAPPNLLPKPRYAHLPARPPSDGAVGPKPIPSHMERSASGLTTESTSMEDLRDAQFVQRTRRSSTAADSSTLQRNIPIHVEEAADSRQTLKQQNLSSPDLPCRRASVPLANQTVKENSKHSSKPTPVFRTAVHGLVLGGSKPVTETISEHDDESTCHDGAYEAVPIMQSPMKQQIMELVRSPVKPVDRNHNHMTTVENDPYVASKPGADEMELNHAKEEMVARLSAKIELLKKEQSSIQDEIGDNDAIGEDILANLAKVASSSDLEKYKQHLKELEEITSLTMSLTSRIEKVNFSLSQLKLPGDELEASTLQNKRNKLTSQYQEAVYLQKGIERRRATVQNFLSQNYLSPEDYEEYDQYFKDKTMLLRDRRSLDDKIRLGEEQLLSLQTASSLY